MRSQRHIGVNAAIPAAKTIRRRQGGAAAFPGNSALGDAINDPAPAAAAEDHGIGALMHFDPFDVVKAAIILSIVPQAIDKEVGRRGIAAQRDLVSMAFPLPGRSAGHMADQI